ERVVTVAASLARQFTLGQIAAMDRIGVADLGAPDREVLDDGILFEVSGQHAFQHDLAREAVRGAIPDAVRRALDRAAGDVLLAGGGLPLQGAAQLSPHSE